MGRWGDSDGGGLRRMCGLKGQAKLDGVSSVGRPRLSWRWELGVVAEEGR